MTGGRRYAMYCRTCRRALNVHTGAGRVEYLHATDLRGGCADHPADPVPVTELPDPEQECDFCSSEGPQWIYVCADQRTETRRVVSRVVGASDYRNRHHAARTRRAVTEPGITQAWGDRWAACGPCAELIERRDILGLIGRVVESLPSKLTRGNRLTQVRGELHTAYSTFFATLAPGRGRITADDPLGIHDDPPDTTR